MIVDFQNTDYSALLARALEMIKKLTADQPRLTQKGIAILGMGCRLPGGCSDPDAFWKFLRAGGDGVIKVPKDRWCVDELFAPEPTPPGKIYLKEAGFLQEDVSQFDAHFFGISPREANEMDPQQRLLLEVCWEALERAGIAPDRIRGSRTGVFIGQIGSEYASLPRAEAFGNSYTLTGTMSNITAGRISYVLGIHGPSIAIDTACSSSLVAVHLACESLNRGECDLAIVGGVNLLLSSSGFSSLCTMGALSRDGRCKTFSANGDGYGRGEGCGIIVLKRVADARLDSDPILAVIKGSGVNQDGPGSGLTVPNGLAQRALMRETLEQAGVQPAQIGYFEAHGTGTSLGDPIEFEALCDVFGNDPARTAPLVVGSVKSNIGHLEAAAGIAGLIKLVLCVQHREIPPNLHLDTVNPKIQLNRIPAIVPQAVTPWLADDQPLISAISSFGFSGTNAHVIVADAPPMQAGAREVNEDRPVHVLALSAKSRDALNDLAARYDRLLADDHGPRLADICHTANVGRSHFAHRLAVAAADRCTLREGLSGRAVALSRERSKTNRSVPKIAFVANGMGDRQLAGCLFNTQPAFRKAAQACNEVLLGLLGKGIVDSWTGGSSAANADVEAFCLQYGLLQMWAYWGVRPRAVLGARSGELVSACAAGVMDLRIAIELIVGDGAASHDASLRNAETYVLSATTGRQAAKSDTRSASYWARVATTDARLEVGVDNLVSQGYDTFVCLGSKEGDDEIARRLSAAGSRCVPFLPADPWPDLGSSVAELYESGVEIDWAGFDRGYARTRIVLPTYPFQRKRFWIEQTSGNAVLTTYAATNVAPTEVTDALEGRLIVAPVQEKLVEFTLPLRAVPDVRDTHGVLHAGYFLEILGRGALHFSPDSPFMVARLAFISALVLREDWDNTVMLTLDRKSDDELAFAVHFHSEDVSTWTRHAQGVVRLGRSRPPVTGDSSPDSMTNWKKRFAEHQTGVEFYDGMARTRRLELGQGVHWIADVWTNGGEALARFETPPSVDTSRSFAIGVHPGVFDACAQLFHAALPSEVDSNMRFMVNEWTDVEWSDSGYPLELWCHVVVDHFDPASAELHGRFELLNEVGHTVARVERAVMKGISAAREKVLQQLAGHNSARPTVAGDSEIMTQLRDTAADDRLRVLEDYLSRCFAGLLEMDPSDLDVDERLGDLGIDSLVAVSAKSRLEAELGVNFPIASLIEGPSVRKLTTTILPTITIVTRPLRKESSPKKRQERDKAEDSSRCIALRKPKPAAKVKLFCVPYGRGKGASVFRGWQALLPDEVEVCPIQLPGKESRIQERPFEDIDTCIDALCDALSSELDRPYAFYGHSVGGLIAYRLAYRLNQTQKRKPHHLFVGAYSSPTVHPNPMIQLTQRMFADIGYDDIPAPVHLLTATKAEQEKILNALTSEADLSDELAKVLLPSRLAELKLVQSFTWDGESFDVPITAFHGLRDDRVHEEHMAAWRKITSASFKLHRVSGDHLFLSEDQDQRSVVKHIEQGLSDILKGR